MNKLNQLNKFLARIFGFTRTGRSLLGKKLALARISKRLRRLATVGLVLVIFLTVTAHNASFAANIGGIPTITTSPEIKNVTVDTKITVRVPVDVLYISQKFSWFHSGIDLVAHTGTPVYPIMDGLVIATPEEWFGYGKHVIIDHGAGFTSLYGHLSKIETKVGDRVTTQTEIGLSGSTGFSTGPHLHLEVHQDGKLIDPAEILPEIVAKQI